MKLFLMTLLGLLIVHVGLHGGLGSMIGAIVAPDYMTEVGPGGSENPIPQ